MIPIYVPDLKKKLDLIVRHANYKNLAQIATEMDVKESTLRSWTVNHTGRVEGTVSKKGREPVIRFFCAHLTHLSEQSVIDLLEGPYDALADAFSVQNRRGLSDFIESEAKFGEAKLVFKEEKSFAAKIIGRMFQSRVPEQFKLPASKSLSEMHVGKAESDTGIPRPKETLDLGTEFHLHFEAAHRAKYYLGLTQNLRGWRVLKASSKIVSETANNSKPIGSGIFVDMSGYYEYGPCRVTLIQSALPFPEFIHLNLNDSIPLSRTDIAFLADHLQSLAKIDRSLQAIDIDFV